MFNLGEQVEAPPSYYTQQSPMPNPRRVGY